jgi:hypothetical protein
MSGIKAVDCTEKYVICYEPKFCIISQILERTGSTSFQAFTMVIFEDEVFRVVTPCSVVLGHRRFRGPCCLRLQGEVTTGISPQHYTASETRRPRLRTDNILSEVRTEETRVILERFEQTHVTKFVPQILTQIPTVTL